MAKKKVNKTGKVTMSGAELNKLLCEAWDLGCMTGRGQAEEFAREQSDDCMRVLRDKYKTLKVEVEYAD